MKVNASNITKHELIGLTIKVVKAKNKSLVGKKGTIIDETKNTLTLSSGKRLLKDAIVLQTKINGKTVEVEGQTLVGRPEDRIKK